MNNDFQYSSPMRGFSTASFNSPNGFYNASVNLQTTSAMNQNDNQAKNPIEAASPNFIPFEYNSPPNSIGRQQRGYWNRRSTGNRSSSSSTFSSPQSSCSSPYSPYSRPRNDFNGNKGNGFRNNSFRPSMRNNYNASAYFDRAMVSDPWADLEQQYKLNNSLKKESSDDRKTTSSTNRFGGEFIKK